MVSGFFGFSTLNIPSWVRWFLGAFLIYGVLSLLLIPLLSRQILIPTIADRTGVSLQVHRIHWHPLALTLQLEGVSIGVSSDPEMFQAKQLDFDFGLLRSLYHRAVALDRLQIVEPSMDIHPTKEGETNLEVLMAGIQRKSPDQPEPPDHTPLRLAVSHLEVMGGRLNYAVPSMEPPLKIHALDLSVQHYFSWKSSPVNLNVALQLNDQAYLTSEGTFLPDGTEAQGLLKAQNIDLSLLGTQILQSLDIPRLEGVLDISGHFHLNATKPTQFQIEDLHTELRDLKIRRPAFELPVMTLGKLQIKQGVFDLVDHRFEAKTLEIQDLGVIDSKTSDGIPAWQTLTPRPAPSAPHDPEDPVAPWKLRVDHCKLNNLHLLPKSGDAASFQPDIRLGQMEIEALRLDNAAQAFDMENVTLKDARLLLGFDDYSLQPLDALSPLSSEKMPAGNSGEGASSWAVRIHQTDVSDLMIGVIPLSSINPTPFSLNNTHIELGPIDTRGAADTPVTFTSEASSGGKLSLSGLFNVPAQSMTADLALDQIGLSPLRSLLSDSFRFGTMEGLLSTQLKLRGRITDGVPDAAYSGQLRLDGLRLTQSPGDRKLLAWKSLAIDGMTGKFYPTRFSASEIRVINPDGVIAIREDKASNLSDLKIPLRTDRNDPANSLASGAAKSPDSEINIQRIRIEGGKLDYSDLSLVLPFTTQIVDLKGAITGWTLEPTGRSLVELNGRIAPYGEAAIHGQVRPRDPKSSMEIDLHFENVILAALTPYSATFAGRKIEEGKLDLNAHYRLEDQQLTSDNRIFLKQLRLGDKVESPKAVSLPLDLAVALLSDTEGNIDVSLPIEGRTDAPDFDYGTIVLNALGNLIKKAVLSPFTVLSGVLGLEGGNGLDSIAFDLGSDVLTPPEKEKIGRLTEALRLKPQLELSLHGVYEPREDLLALKQSWLRTETGTRLKEVIKPGEDPGPVNPSEPSTQRVLETMAKDFDVLNATLTQYESEKGHAPDRVGLVGPLFGRGSKTPDFYEQLVRALVEHAPIGPLSLEQLAQRRMAVVKAALTSSGKSIAATRVKFGEIIERSSEDGHHLLMPLTLEVE